jgi:hypothetical protein
VLTLILAAAAGVCLALGWLVEQVVLVYVALGLSVAGLALVVTQLWARRRRAGKDPVVSLIPSSNDAEATDDTEDEPDRSDTKDTNENADAAVHIVAGRKRFHLAGCRLLDGHDSEELTLVEAREENFTPCTVCVGAEPAGVLAGST